MPSKNLFLAPFFVLAFLVALSAAGTGCQTPSGASFGAAIGIGKPSRTAQAAPSPSAPRSAGQEQAGRNSLRNAYKFLEKGMTEQARKELEKAEERLGKDFWYNYYMAGALQMENRPTESNSYFELALRYSPTDSMRSRVRVCQSFVYFALDQDGKSGQMLDLAILLDPANGTAKSLRDDLDAGGLAQDDDAKAKKGKKDKSEDKGKGKGKSRKLGSSDQFRSYFLVQMPDQ